MAARVEEERDDRPTSTNPTRTQDTVPPPPQRDGGETQVSLTQFRATFPGLVSVAQGG